MEKTMNFEEYVKDFVHRKLNDYIGTEVYGCDLGYKLTESENINGSITYNRYKAIEYIKEWWDEAAEVYDYQKENYGDVTQNPFDNPEAYMVVMVIEGCDALLSNSYYLQENWNDEFELTKENVETIWNEIKDCRIEF